MPYIMPCIVLFVKRVLKKHRHFFQNVGACNDSGSHGIIMANRKSERGVCRVEGVAEFGMARMRRKKNLVPRMERCSSYQILPPFPAPGSWRTAFGAAADATLALEIGCGKGGFAVRTAQADPSCCLIAMDRVNEALVVGMERAASEQVQNLRFLSGDCAMLSELFAPGEVDIIYLNFSDPWPSKRHAKRRLTYRTFLEIYRKLLADDGVLYFKTDNRDLFEFSLEEFSGNGFLLDGVTYDLHATDLPNIPTEYEEKFAAAGMPIHRLAARKQLAASDAPEAEHDA